jgi:hypothetical protein
MASYIHAGIPSSLWANPPKHPPIIHTSLLGNLTLQQCLFVLPFSFSFLTQFLQWTPFHSLILPSLHCYLAKIVQFQCPVTYATRGDLCKK